MNTLETAWAIAEEIGAHVASEYEGDRALDDLIIRLRHAIAAASPPVQEESKQGFIAGGISALKEEK